MTVSGNHDARRWTHLSPLFKAPVLPALPSACRPVLFISIICLSAPSISSAHICSIPHTRENQYVLSVQSYQISLPCRSCPSCRAAVRGRVFQNCTDPRHQFHNQHCPQWRHHQISLSWLPTQAASHGHCPMSDVRRHTLTVGSAGSARRRTAFYATWTGPCGPV